MSVKHTLFYLCSHTEVWYADASDANVDRAPEAHFTRALCEAETCRTLKRQYIYVHQATYENRVRAVRVYEQNAAVLKENVKAVLTIIRSCIADVGDLKTDIIEAATIDTGLSALILSLDPVSAAATKDEKIENIFKFAEITVLIDQAQKYVDNASDSHAAVFYQFCVNTVGDLMKDATATLNGLRTATIQLLEHQPDTTDVIHVLPSASTTTQNRPTFTATTQQGTQYTTADFKLLMSVAEGREMVHSGILSDRPIAKAMYLIDEAREALGLERRVAATVVEDFDRLGPQALNQAKKFSLMHQFTKARENTGQFLVKKAVVKDQIARWRDADGQR